MCDNRSRQRHTYMKEIIRVLCVILIASSFCFGQDIDSQTLEFKKYIKGTHTFDLGIGLLNATGTAVNVAGIGNNFTAQPSPSINLQYEYAIDQTIGIGAYFDYYRVNSDIEIPPLDDIANDPVCAVTCALGINTADCNCSGYDYTDRVNVFTIAGRLAYHTRILEGLDTYTSIIAGYSFNRRQSAEEILVQQVLRETDVADNLPTFIYKVSAGGKYYINNKWGIYGEFGWANTHLIRLGITHRLL